ncbi:hypothetical protein V8C86DRAFT_36702 [Haematococcus lacustris]
MSAKSDCDVAALLQKVPADETARTHPARTHLQPNGKPRGSCKACVTEMNAAAFSKRVPRCQNEVPMPSACADCGMAPGEAVTFTWQNASAPNGGYWIGTCDGCTKKRNQIRCKAARAAAKAENEEEFLAHNAKWVRLNPESARRAWQKQNDKSASDPTVRLDKIKASAVKRGISFAEGEAEASLMRGKLQQPCHYCHYYFIG